MFSLVLGSDLSISWNEITTSDMTDYRSIGWDCSEWSWLAL